MPVGQLSQGDQAAVNRGPQAAVFSGATLHFRCWKSSRGHSVRKKVDSRIQELEDEIRALKTHRNTAAITGALPAEVLSNIFLLNVAMYHDRKSNAWIRVAGVCRHWRAVALSCAALWTDFIRPAKPEFITLMLEQSRKMPITVDMRLPNRSLNEQERILFSQNERLLNVALSGRNSEDCGAVSALLPTSSGPAVSLKSLTLTGCTKEDYRSGLVIKPLKVADNFLQQGAPVLTHLDLVQCSIPWDSLSLPGSLTHSFDSMET